MTELAARSIPQPFDLLLAGGAMSPDAWATGRHEATRDRSAFERGSSLVEYCLLLALISLVTIGAVTAFGTARDSMFERSASSMFAP